MTIKQYGGVFGRNPTFNNVTIEGTLTFDGDIDINSDLTISGNLYLPDNSKAIFGDNDDLQIYHDGSNSYVSDQGTGDLRILAADFRIRNAADDETMIQANSDADVSLWYNNSKKLATTNTGIDVTGTVTMDGLVVDGATTFNVGNTTGDGVVISGTDSGGSTAPDLVLYRDSSSPADGDNVGMLQFRGNTSTSASANYAAIFASIDDVTDGTMDGSLSFSVTSSGNQAPSSGTVIMTLDSTGIDVTGSVTADGLTVDSTNNSGNTGTPTIVIKDLDTAVSAGQYTGAIEFETSDTGNPGINSYIRSVMTGSGGAGSFTFGTGFAGSLADRVLIDDNGDISFYEDTGTTPKFFWDASAESLGIGTSSPAQMLHLSGAVPDIQYTDTTGNEYRLGNNNGSFRLYDVTAAAERMRIDASGNLLVGTTSTAVSSSTGSVTGTVINNTGLFEAAKTGTVMELNRLTDDGTILNFRKDGTTVGIIGTESNRLTIGTDDTGLIFSSLNYIRPWNPTANIAADADISLGGSNDRFKNLYLSGGVVFGTTGGSVSSKTLDDYEEGTWTPVIADAVTGGNEATTSSAGGKYTKVGNLVTIVVDMQNIDTTGLTTGVAIILRGLPFQAATAPGGLNYIGSVMGGGTFATPFTVIAAVQDSLQYARFQDAESSGVSNFLNVGNINSGATDIRFSLTYQAA